MRALSRTSRLTIAVAGLVLLIPLGAAAQTTTSGSSTASTPSTTSLFGTTSTSSLFGTTTTSRLFATTTTSRFTATTRVVATTGRSSGSTALVGAVVVLVGLAIAATVRRSEFEKLVARHR